MLHTSKKLCARDDPTTNGSNGHSTSYSSQVSGTAELVKLGILNNSQQNALRNALLRGDADALKAMTEFETTRSTVGITRLVASGYFDSNMYTKLDRIGSDIDLSAMTVSSPLSTSLSPHRIPSPIESIPNGSNDGTTVLNDLNGQPFTIGIINASTMDKITGIHTIPHGSTGTNTSSSSSTNSSMIMDKLYSSVRGTVHTSTPNGNYPIQPMSSILAQKLLESLPETILQNNTSTATTNNPNSDLNDKSNVTQRSLLSATSSVNRRHNNNDQHSDTTTLTNVLSSSELSSKASSNNDSSDHSTPFDTTDTSEEELPINGTTNNTTNGNYSSNNMNNNRRTNSNNSNESSSLSSSTESSISYLPIEKNTNNNDHNKVPNKNSTISCMNPPPSTSSVRNLIQTSNNTNNLLTSTVNPVDPMLSSLKRPRGSSNFVFSGSFDLTTSQGSFDLSSTSSTPNFMGNGLVSSSSSALPFGNSLFSMNNNNNSSNNNAGGTRSSSLASPSSVLSPLQSVLQHNLRQSGMQNTNPVVASSSTNPTASSLLNPFSSHRGLIPTNTEDVAAQMAAVVAGRILPGNPSSSSNTIPSASVAAISVATPESLTARIAANMNRTSSSSSLLRNKNSALRTIHSSSASTLNPSYPHNDPLTNMRSRGLSEDMLLLSASNEFNISLNYSSSNNSAGAAPSIVTTLTELNHNHQLNNSLSRGTSSNSILSQNSDNSLLRRYNAASTYPDSTFDPIHTSSYSGMQNSSVPHTTNVNGSTGVRERSQHSSSQRGSHPLSRLSSTGTASSVAKPVVVRPVVRDLWDEPFDQIDTMVDSITETNVVRNNEADDNTSSSDSDGSIDSDLQYDEDDDDNILKDMEDMHNVDEDTDDALEPNVRGLPLSTIVSARQLSASPLNHITSYSYNRHTSNPSSAIPKVSHTPMMNTSSIRLVHSGGDNMHSSALVSQNKPTYHADPMITTGTPSYPKKKGTGATITVPGQTYASSASSNVAPNVTVRGPSPAVSPSLPKDNYPSFHSIYDNSHIPSNATIIPVPINATTASRNLELENAGITLANGYGVLSCTETMIIDEIMLPVVPRVKTWIGAYPPAARYERLQRFLSKRNQRVWEKTVKYDVRKSFADSRLRVKGRFVKKEDEALLRDFMQLL